MDRQQPGRRRGPLPEGLANLSAQGCAACHYTAHDRWAGSAHATGHASEAFRAAVDEVGDARCTSCHRPLTVQHADRPMSLEQAGPMAVTVANPDHRPTLALEGVTCAACHVREGAVIGTEPLGPAPHAQNSSPALTDTAMCASCHQWSWPGRDEAFYDTWGEWSRSAYAVAGIGCTDCHYAAAADGGADHAFPARVGRGLSVLVELAPETLVRGGGPVAASVIVQNTGAGHAVPTGTPWRAVEIAADLVATPVGGEPVRRPLDRLRLERTVADVAPYAITADTRLPAASSRRLDLPLELAADAPAGPWFLEVRVQRWLRGRPDGEPVQVQRVPVRTD